MVTPAEPVRVYFIGTPHKSNVAPVLDELAAFAAPHCAVVGKQVGLDGQKAVEAAAERILVLGGDGTLIGVARSLGSTPIPLIGVNIGKLGFLVEFSLNEVKAHFDRILRDESLVARRKALAVRITQGEEVRYAGRAINDCVIQAGPPFRMITLGVAIDGEHLTDVRGDGLIVCTPSGSTGHNLSAGGPIMQPGVDAIVLTPLNPHSLTHRPLVIERDAVIEITASLTREGTTAIIDGQVSCPLKPRARVTVRRADTGYLLVRNPRHARWHNLVTKLHWGQPPDYE